MKAIEALDIIHRILMICFILKSIILKKYLN